MKRNSTVTVGIDIGDRYSHVAKVDDAGELVSQGRIRTTPEAVNEDFAGRPRTRVVLEAGTHSNWMARLLEELGHEVIVANPRKVRMCVTNKTDRRDAEFLARLGRADPKLLHAVRVKSERTQETLTIVRSRDAVIRARTQMINHVRAMVKNVGERLPSRSGDGFHKNVDSVPESLRAALSPMMACIERLTMSIKQYDKEIAKLCNTEFAETAALRQVTGVGPLTSLTFVLTLESPDRFRNARAAGAYLGLCPRRQQSGNSDPQLRISKAGDPLMRRYLVSAAQYILGPFGPDTDLRRWGERLAARGGKNAKKRAIVAVARRLSALLFALWKTGEEYEPLRLSNRNQEAAA